MSQQYIRANDDELSPGVPTPRPSPGTAYTHGQKAEILGRILAAWLDVPGMRLGQVLYAAAANCGEHVSQIKDSQFAEAIETWVGEYR